MPLFDPWELWIAPTMLKHGYPQSWAKYLEDLSGPEDVEDDTPVNPNIEGD